MKRSEILLRAAKDVASGLEYFCCSAIRYQMDIPTEDRVNCDQWFEEFYDHPKDDFYSGWFGKTYPKNQNTRVLALLFAYHAAKDLEKAK